MAIYMAGLIRKGTGVVTLSMLNVFRIYDIDIPLRTKNAVFGKFGMPDKLLRRQEITIETFDEQEKILTLNKNVRSIPGDKKVTFSVLRDDEPSTTLNLKLTIERKPTASTTSTAKNAEETRQTLTWKIESTENQSFCLVDNELIPGSMHTIRIMSPRISVRLSDRCFPDGQTYLRCAPIDSIDQITFQRDNEIVPLADDITTGDFDQDFELYYDDVGLKMTKTDPKATTPNAAQPAVDGLKDTASVDASAVLSSVALVDDPESPDIVATPAALALPSAALVGDPGSVAAIVAREDPESVVSVLLGSCMQPVLSLVVVVGVGSYPR
eukprot:GHVS01074113.1.p1 GENE.GHVS01074113.1~~GHVS01074113.1.p1  ORF type:complete len:326 (-),score=20.88 GHVS01074113.1:59-1036(-)